MGLPFSTKFLALALVALGVFSCADDKVAGVEAGNATIAGIIVDSLQNPLQGVPVTLSRTSTGSQALARVAAAGSDSLISRDTTDSLGQFRFDSLKVGKYSVRAMASPVDTLVKYATISTPTQDLNLYFAYLPGLNDSGSSSQASSSSLPSSSSVGGSAIATSSSASSSSAECTPHGLCGTITDPRDNIQYKWVRIGVQTWLAENLRGIPTQGQSWCYLDNDIYCASLGRLYDWSAASVACPAGWHLPSQAAWDSLSAEVTRRTGSYADGKLLRAELADNTSWVAAGDSMGFAAKPNGQRGSVLGEVGTGLWYSGHQAWWWTSDSVPDPQGLANAPGHYALFLAEADSTLTKGVSRADGSGLGIRCVKD